MIYGTISAFYREAPRFRLSCRGHRSCCRDCSRRRIQEAVRAVIALWSRETRGGDRSRGIGLTKSVVSRDRGEHCRLSLGNLIPHDSRVRNYARKVVRRSSRSVTRRGFIPPVLWKLVVPLDHPNSSSSSKTIGTVLDYVGWLRH